MKCFLNFVSKYGMLCATLRQSDKLRDVLRDSGVLKKGACNYLLGSLDDYDLWLHLLDGTITILSDSLLVEQLPTDLRYLSENLLAYWSVGELNEENWAEFNKHLRKAIVN